MFATRQMKSLERAGSCFKKKKKNSADTPLPRPLSFSPSLRRFFLQQELARESSHQQFSVVHLASALFDDADGVAKQAVMRVGDAATLSSIRRTLKSALSKLPSVSPAVEQPDIAPDALKALRGTFFFCRLSHERGERVIE